MGKSRDAKRKAKREIEFKSKHANEPPSICVTLLWGKSMLGDEDEEEILCLPAKLSLHNLCGMNIPPPQSTPSSSTTPLPATPSSSTTPPLSTPPSALPPFDPTFDNDEDLKYHLMAEWYNVKKKEKGNNDPGSCDRIHNHSFWEKVGPKHAEELHLSVNDYFKLGLKTFEFYLKKTLNKAIRKSMGDSFGRLGSRTLDVKEFLRMATEEEGMHPTIHKSLKPRSMKLSGSQEVTCQTLHEIKIHFNPTDMSYMYSPGYPEGTQQGTYDIEDAMYLV